jgi:hypothetical protein
LPDFGDLFSAAELRKIDSTFDEYRKKKNESNTNRLATASQLERYVKWDDLVDGLEKLTIPMERLLYGLYVLQPPLRADYGDVRVMKGDDVRQEMRETDNVYVHDTGEVIISQYKTSANKDPIVFIVNDELKEIIDATNVSSRKYLLYNIVKNTPDEPISANYLGHQLQNISTRIMKKRTGINDFRHAFIQKYNITNAQYSDVINNARLMGSSVDVQISEYIKSNYPEE